MAINPRIGLVPEIVSPSCTLVTPFPINNNLLQKDVIKARAQVENRGKAATSATGICKLVRKGASQSEQEVIRKRGFAQGE